MAKKTRTDGGFTLIEVILAVVLLAAGLTAILGLQGSVAGQTVRDSDRQFALLAGRQILARMEANESDPPERNQSQSLEQALSEMEMLNDSDFSAGDRARLTNFQTTIVTEPVRIPDYDKQVLRKISLTISWGASDLDSVVLVYFVPIGVPKDETA